MEPLPRIASWAEESRTVGAPDLGPLGGGLVWGKGGRATSPRPSPPSRMAERVGRQAGGWFRRVGGGGGFGLKGSWGAETPGYGRSETCPTLTAAPEPLSARGFLVAGGGPSDRERNFIPHPTTLARGRRTGNRWGGLAGYGFGAIGADTDGWSGRWGAGGGGGLTLGTGEGAILTIPSQRGVDDVRGQVNAGGL